MLQLAVLCCVVMLATPAKTYSQFKSYPDESGNGVKDYSTRQREKRVAGVVGILGVILRNARLIGGTRTKTLYIKGGGLKQAKEDFKAFNPTNVRDHVVSMSGKSGRDDVQLINFHGEVSLKIREVSTNGFFLHTIQYFD